MVRILFLDSSHGGEGKVSSLVSQFSSVQSLSYVQLFVIPWTAARQASLSITNSQSLLKPMSIVSVMPSNHLILCRPLILPSIFPSIRVFSSELLLLIRWPNYWSFSFSISPSSEYSGLISFRIHWFDLLVLQEGVCLPAGRKLGPCLTLRNELSEKTHVLTKQEILLGKGSQVESSRVREPRRTALPRGSQSWVLW